MILRPYLRGKDIYLVVKVWPANTSYGHSPSLAHWRMTLWPVLLCPIHITYTCRVPARVADGDRVLEFGTCTLAQDMDDEIRRREYTHSSVN